MNAHRFKTDTVPAFWWCRGRISPDCTIMNPVDYVNVPRATYCRACRLVYQKRWHDAHRNTKAEYRIKASRRRRLKEERGLCQKCGLQPIHKDLRFLCLGCYSNSDDRVEYNYYQCG